MLRMRPLGVFLPSHRTSLLRHTASAIRPLRHHSEARLAAAFASDDVRQILVQLSHIDLYRYHRPWEKWPMDSRNTRVAFLSNAELQRLQRTALANTVASMRIPPHPLQPPASKRAEVIMRDEGLAQLDMHKIAFLDISESVPEHARDCVMLLSDGTLRHADRGEFSRLTKTAVPRRYRPPTLHPLFGGGPPAEGVRQPRGSAEGVRHRPRGSASSRGGPPPVEGVRQRGSAEGVRQFNQMLRHGMYKDLIKMTYTAFLIDEPQLTDYLEAIYEHINHSGNFASLKSTRFFPGLLYYLVTRGAVEKLMLHYLQSGRTESGGGQSLAHSLADVANLFRLKCAIFDQIQSDNVQQASTNVISTYALQASSPGSSDDEHDSSETVSSKNVFCNFKLSDTDEQMLRQSKQFSSETILKFVSEYVAYQNEELPKLIESSKRLIPKLKIEVESLDNELSSVESSSDSGAQRAAVEKKRDEVESRLQDLSDSVSELESRLADVTSLGESCQQLAAGSISSHAVHVDTCNEVTCEVTCNDIASRLRRTEPLALTEKVPLLNPRFRPGERKQRRAGAVR